MEELQSAPKTWWESLEKVHVYIYGRMNFLNEDFEYESYVGTNQLRNMFIDKKIDDITANLVLVFPERWLNVVQQMDLINRIYAYYPNLKTLCIKTQSPLIITNCYSEYCYRVDFNSDDEESVDDAISIFKGISKGKLFVNGESQ